MLLHHIRASHFILWTFNRCLVCVGHVVVIEASLADQQRADSVLCVCVCLPHKSTLINTLYWVVCWNHDFLFNYFYLWPRWWRVSRSTAVHNCCGQPVCCEDIFMDIIQYSASCPCIYLFFFFIIAISSHVHPLPNYLIHVVVVL